MRRLLFALFLAGLPAAALATPVTMPVVGQGGSVVQATGTVAVDSTGADATDTTNHALKVTCVTGCGGGGGGGGAVTAASGAYAAGSIVDLGTGSSPAANTTNAWLKSLNTALGSPLQAGGTVLGPLPASPVAGQQTLTTSAAALPSNALQNGVVITAFSTDTGTVYVGASGVTSGTGYPLSPGQSISFAVANTSGVYIIGTNTTDKIAFAGN